MVLEGLGRAPACAVGGRPDTDKRWVWVVGSGREPERMQSVCAVSSDWFWDCCWVGSCGDDQSEFRGAVLPLPAPEPLLLDEFERWRGR